MPLFIQGPPGSGKGTQSDKIIKNFNLYKVSTGHLLREEIRNNTDLGKKIKPVVDKGLLVSDDIINNTEDTLTLLDKYIDELDVTLDKDRLKNTMKTLYNEAQDLEL